MGSRIAHFTDLHFTEDPRAIRLRDLFSKRGLGWINLRLRGRYESFEKTPVVVQALVEDLAGLEADALIFTGDVTGLALDSEFRSARRCLGSLVDDPRVLGIPGNHDVYVREAEKRRVFETTFPEWVRNDLTVIDRGDGSRERPLYPLLRLVGDDVAVVAIKDSRAAALHDSSGKVSHDQLTELRRIVELPEVVGRTLVLAMHYCVRLPDGRRDTRLHRLRNDIEVIELAEELGFELILAGHVHHRMVHLAGSNLPIHLCNPGSLTYGGRDLAYHLIDFDRGLMTLSARRYDEELGAFRPWEKAEGIGRLPV